MARFAGKEGDRIFKLLVLQGIWLLFMAIRNKDDARVTDAAVGWQMGALDFCDETGVQTEEARKYRREKTFPWV